MITERDRHFLEMAKEYANLYSQDPSFLSGENPDSAVGVVIVTANGKVFRDTNRAYVDSGTITVENKKYYIEHAERSGIAGAHRSGLLLSGATMYVTKYPCADCARAISAELFSRVVVLENYKDGSKWYESQCAAEYIFKSNFVEVDVNL